MYGRPRDALLPPPQVFEGSTNFIEPGRRRPWAVVHCGREGAGEDAVRVERWMIYDRAAMRAGGTFRAIRATDPRVHESWALARPHLEEPPVQAILEQRVTPRSPPATAEETGETGRLMSFRLFCGRTPASLYEAGGLLRIDHEDGTWTDHWALWSNWHDVDATWRMEARRVEGPNSPKTVREFLERMLVEPKNWAPGVGEWVHAPRCQLQTPIIQQVME